MTTTTGSETESQHRVIREIFQSLAEREIRVKDVYTTSPAALREKTGDDTGWLEFVTREWHPFRGTNRTSQTGEPRPNPGRLWD